MTSFRQKVFISYTLLLVLFLVLMFPFVTNSVQQIVYRSMSDCAEGLIQELKTAKDDQEIVQILKEQKRYVFYRIGILDSQRRLLYDSHTKRLLGAPFFPLQFVTHPEIETALQHGTGYSEEYSHLLGQQLIYLAKQFEFHGQVYVIRLAFPFQYIQELKNGFTVGFLFFGALVLVLFSILSVILLNHFSSPIRQIISSIRGYKEGNLETLPKIKIRTGPKDEFTYLANTINSLSRRVRCEIETVVRERNEREAILESLSEGVLAVDSHFTVSYVNRSALFLLGKTVYIVGHPVSGTIPPKCQRLLERCCHKQTMVIDEIEFRKGNTRFHLNIVATPRRLGGGAILVFHDTSVQHQMIEMRKAFVANASHELKTPITVIRGFAETVYENPNLSLDTLQHVNKRIVDNCQRMTTIIKNLLTLADIENLPAFRVVQHDIVDLLQACTIAVRSVWKETNVRVEYSGDTCIVEIDPTLLEIAICNLLENAAKYSTQPAIIDVRIQHTETQVLIEIQDYGMGIPETDLEHIFQRFYRVPEAKKLGGSGLGLSIVETIIEKHFGRVEVRSTLGQGTCFSVYLPIDLTKQLYMAQHAGNAHVGLYG